MRSPILTHRSVSVLFGSAGIAALLALSGCDQGKPESDSQQPTVVEQSEKTEQQILSGTGALYPALCQGCGNA